MFVTYGFVHGGLLHLAVNMITLWSVGLRCLQRMGPAKFAVLYTLSLLGGAAAFGVLAADLTPMVGASGALFGLIGAILAWEYVDRTADAMPLWPVLRAIAILVALNLVLWWAMNGLLAWQTHLGGFIVPGAAMMQDALTSRTAGIRVDASDEADRARRLFEWTRDQIRYTVYAPFHLPEHYRPTRVWDWGAGYCVQKAVFLVSLARAAGIPARLVFADIINHRTPEALAGHTGVDFIIPQDRIELRRLSDQQVTVFAMMDKSSYSLAEDFHFSFTDSISGVEQLIKVRFRGP